jgi:hypothetical protein
MFRLISLHPQAFLLTVAGLSVALAIVLGQ